MCEKTNDCSHVGMEICLFCGEPKNIIISEQLKSKIPKKFVADSVPCEECIKRFEKGFTFFIVTEEEPSQKYAADMTRIDNISDNSLYLTGGYMVFDPEGLPEELRKEPEQKMFITMEEAIEVGLIQDKKD